MVWLAAAISTFGKRIVDANLVKCVQKQASIKALERLARSNELHAKSVEGIAQRIDSVALKKYSNRLYKLANRQYAKSERVGKRLNRLEPLMRNIVKDWTRNSDSIIKRAVSGRGKYSVLLPLVPAIGYKQSLTNKAQQELEYTSTELSNCGNGDFEPHVAGAISQLIAGACSTEQSAVYWARMYLSSWKFGCVHVLPRCRARPATDKVGNIITWIPEAESYETEWCADFAPKFFVHQKAIYTRFLCSLNSGSITPTAKQNAARTGHVCRGIADELQRAFDSLSIHSEATHDRLTTIFRAAAERVYAVDWHKAIGSLRSTYHNRALCDSAVCQFDELCQVCEDIRPYTDLWDELNIHDRTCKALEGVASRIRDEIEGLERDGRHDGIRDGLTDGRRGEAEIDSSTETAVSRHRSNSTGSDATGSTIKESSKEKSGDPRGVHIEVKSNSIVHCENTSHPKDVGGQGKCHVEERLQSGSSNRIGVDAHSSTGGYDTRRKRSVVDAKPVKQRPDNMVGAQSGEARLELPLGVVDGAQSAGEIATTVGPSLGEMLSHGARKKARRSSARTTVPTSNMLGTKKEDNEGRIPSTLLGAGCARGLLSQSVTCDRWACTWCYPPDGPDICGVFDAYYRDIVKQTTHDAFSCTRGCCLSIPSKKAQKILSRPGNISINWTDKEGRNYKLIRQDGKDVHRGKERRPENDTNTRQCVSSDLLADVEAVRTQFNDGNRSYNGSTDDSKRQQPRRKSENAVYIVENEDQPSGYKFGPVEMGYACTSSADGSSVEAIQQSHPGSPNPLVHAQPLKQHVLYEPANKIQSSRRRHEWGYDDGSWELYCCDCHSADISRSSIQRCFRRRREACIDSAYSPVYYSSRHRNARSSDDSSSSEAGRGLAHGIRRRRRSRRDSGRGKRGHTQTTPSVMVESPRAFPKGRRSSRSPVPTGILPTQTFYRREKANDGTEPLQGNTKIVPSNRKVSGRPEAVFENGLYSKSYAAQGYTSTRTFLPKSSVEVGQWSYAGSGFSGVSTRKQQPPLPFKLRSGQAVSPGQTRNSGGRPLPFLENVGHDTYRSNPVGTSNSKQRLGKGNGELRY